MTYEYITDDLTYQAKAMIQDYWKILEPDDKRIIGCSEEEIEKLEKGLPAGYKLPKAYKEFLAFGGKQIVRVYQATNFSYELAILLQETNYRDVIDDLEAYDEDFTKLPENIFVIYEHLGANFTFFKLDEGDNPPIYYWTEENEGGLETVTKKYDSFIDYLKVKLECARYFLQSTKETRKKFP